MDFVFYTGSILAFVVSASLYGVIAWMSPYRSGAPRDEELVRREEHRRHVYQALGQAAMVIGMLLNLIAWWVH